MKTVHAWCFGFALISTNAALAKTFDVNGAWQQLNTVLATHYAYLGDAENHQAVEQAFRKKLNDVYNKQDFIDLSQSYLRHFTDPHLNLGPLNEDDYIVYPTGADIFAVFEENIAVVLDVKRDSAADIEGIRPGNKISTVNGQSIVSAIEDIMQVELSRLTDAQKNYALNIALGGKRYQPRRFKLITKQGTSEMLLPASYDAINALSKGGTVLYKKIEELGYIRFNNAMGNSHTVADFKAALQALGQVQGYIIDLRNTPSGGNTGVAEPILGHFSTTATAYQKYRIQTPTIHYQRAQVETANTQPAQPSIQIPFIALAGRWTGSIGEGMTIGLDALGAIAVVGTPMADLLGGIKRLSLDKSDAWIELGFERLYHVDGRYREDFEPTVIMPGDMDENGNDVTLERAVFLLKQHIDGKREVMN
ncbi:S41 family peptidase [Pseudoalteromonas sp. PS5]|uniref:S41 family peptidase n=1 Tax=Pseudoalteromonas sp. PS5 TaxID=1437473 RepID=UPI000FFF01B8|nr:S41 family peptidase [Pseudoalteromonas sp. PS5]RXE95810.1 carboxyl-terminal protease [Pseudoalteromonas sp. PS5]